MSVDESTHGIGGRVSLKNILRTGIMTAPEPSNILSPPPWNLMFRIHPARVYQVLLGITW